MAQSRGRPSSGPSIISLLSDRYKEPDTARTNVGMVGAGKPGIHRRTEETTYSFSQEEEIRQDGRTVYKTKEEKSFSGKPQPWPGDSAAPAPKVSIKTITLSTKSKDDGQPSQLTNSYGGLQKDGFTSISGSGQPHRQDYQYQQTVSTKTQIERSGFPQQQQQQPQIHQIHQQSVYQQQKQPTFGQQRQQPGYQQQQQQTSYTQQQQQQSVYGQQKQPSYAQQQPSYGQQKQPTYAQPSYGQQQQQPSYAQQKQQPSYGQQKQPSYAQPQQQPTTYGQQQQPSYAQQPQQSSYGQQKQPSYAQPQQPQQPRYAQQRQQQQAAYSQPKPAYQQQQPQQQPQPSQTQVQQQQRPGYQLLQQQLQQQEQQQQQKQQASYQQQQQRQQQQVTSQQQQQRQQQQVTYQQQQQTQQQQATYQQQQQPQQQQVTYQQQQPQQQRLVQQQQQQRQQQVTYQQQQQPQPQQPRYSQPQQPSPQQQQYQQSVHSGVYRQGQPSKATVTTITATSTTSTFAPPPTTSTTTAMDLFSWEDEPEEGVHENVPEQRPDLVRESDRSNWQAELPSIGQARNLKHKFLTGDVENKPVAFKKELTPPSMAGGGVFENQPVYNPDVVHAEELQHEPVPERGTARSMVYRFKEMGRPVYPSGPTPAKREITPDRTTRGEYVSEPRGYVEQYQGRPESGVFESQPLYLDDVIKADEYEDDRLPERGLARSMAGYFREVGNYRPAPSPSRPKEFTPPREEGTALYGYGVYENMPLYDPTVVHAEDQTRDVLPERGMARTIVTRFRKMSSGDSTPKSPRGKKEFTPPRDGGGVYENTPTQFIPEYNRRPESGILENEPQVRYDVVRSDQPLFFEEELPERGTARSLVTTWRHKERSAGATPTGSGKPKEFTPPREEPRVLLQRASSVGYDSYGLSEGSVHPYDLPGQYQPQAEACVFESQPVHLEGVVREADTDWMEGMPRNDTTRKMVAKFRHIQHQAATSADAPTGLDYSSPGPRPPLPPSGRQAQNIRY